MINPQPLYLLYYPLFLTLLFSLITTPLSASEAPYHGSNQNTEAQSTSSAAVQKHITKIYQRLQQIKVRRNDMGSWWLLWFNDHTVAGQSVFAILKARIELLDHQEAEIKQYNDYLAYRLTQQRTELAHTLPLYDFIADLKLYAGKKRGQNGYDSWEDAEKAGWTLELLKAVAETVIDVITAQRQALNSNRVWRKDHKQRQLANFFGQPNWQTGTANHQARQTTMGTLLSQLTQLARQEDHSSSEEVEHLQQAVVKEHYYQEKIHKWTQDILLRQLHRLNNRVLFLGTTIGLGLFLSLLTYSFSSLLKH